MTPGTQGYIKESVSCSKDKENDWEQQAQQDQQMSVVCEPRDGREAEAGEEDEEKKKEGKRKKRENQSVWAGGPRIFRQERALAATKAP